MAVEQREEPSGRQPARPVAERAGRERLLADDEPGLVGRLGELRAHDRVERQVAERSAALPALVARLRHDTLRAGPRLDPLQRLEPLDPREPVAELPPTLGVEEVRREHLDGVR